MFYTERKDSMKPLYLMVMVLFMTATITPAHARKGLELVYFDGHIHTTHSDGSGSIADVKKAARARGLNAVFVTNHAGQIVDPDEWNDIVNDCTAFSEKDFLMIPSFEVTGSEGLFCRDHVLAWGVGNPFTGDPADALVPEDVWPSPENPFGTGPLYPENIRRWTDWIHENGGMAVHAHTSGTTQLSYNVDFIEVINLGHIKDVAGFAEIAGFDADEAWNLALLFNNFAVDGGAFLQRPVDMPNPQYGEPDQPETIQLPLQQALYLGTSLIGDLGENSGGPQWLGSPTPQDLLDAGAVPAAPLNSWDDLLMSYINGDIDHPIYGVANSDAHNTANTDVGSTVYDDSDVGEARNGVYLSNFTPFHFLRAVRRGNLFATTGPSVYFDVEGHLMGETVPRRQGRNKTVHINLSVDSESQSALLTSVAIIKNGDIFFAEAPMTAAYAIQLEDSVSADGYYRVEVISMEADGKPRFAYANPVFVMDDGCRGKAK
jgi:hypothetical protein